MSMDYRRGYLTMRDWIVCVALLAKFLLAFFVLDTGLAARLETRISSDICLLSFLISMLKTSFDPLFLITLERCGF